MKCKWLKTYQIRKKKFSVVLAVIVYETIFCVVLLGVQDLCLLITINRAIFQPLEFIGMLVYVMTVTCVYT